ncbi:hypothetical protein [Photobacterium aquimaris]|uniref:Uncharacterized protein n=1 Tax=Photobacterium aquimaris TaxID=512643 RepID=A0A2T3I0T3_9GAMM|nr:hypothetical protein [Photobacterium aquimaris]OBU25703.1 hypothetical protein AYY21_08965 [Photobacterium aquimaris]PQJ37001.1 hypothetical protein BTN98_17825 [Photobacterium aquimaris]PSU10144.1 hypothetical protein C0W81_05310 [Photobacterium aquimaris]
MQIKNVYEFIDNYLGVALLIEEGGNVVYHNSIVFEYHIIDNNSNIIGENLSKIFLEKAKKEGPLTHAQALRGIEISRLCWLNQGISLNFEHYDNILYRTIRMIIKFDKEYMILLIDKANQPSY